MEAFSLNCRATMFSPCRAPPPNSSSSAPAMADVQVLVIGGGFAGICMAINLLRAGYASFLLVDKLPDLGGTWFLNRYPGCRCDIPSHFFCYSFCRNPNWSSMYADRGEIHQYLKDCAARHGVLPHVRLNTEVISVVWDAADSLWRVAVEERAPLLAGDGEQVHQTPASVVASTIKARFVVRAVGAFHTPNYPAIKGMEKFAGPAFHSSLWDSSISLEGKTVAVIGTGASSIQVVPGIAATVKKLYVLQRSAAWVVPKVSNWRFSKRWRKLFAQLPLLNCLFYWLIFLLHELIIGAVLRWRWARRVAEWVVRKNIHSAIEDADLRRKLLPDYEMGCKRILQSNEFYQAIARANVELVTEPIEEVQENALLVAGGRTLAVDTIVYATGFQLKGDLHVVGADGLDHRQAGFSALLGVTKRGFPNFFTFLGYNSGAGQSSQILPFEAQARYIISCISLLQRRPGRSLQMQPAAASERRHQQFLARRLPKFVWSFAGCSSFYFDKATQQNYTMWPASTLEYIIRTWSAKESDYDFQ